jgi:N-acetylglutamate synthase-like GNAT family acetyltransferase
MDEQVVIRPANINDAESIVSLSDELGYQPTLNEIKNRIISFSSKENQKIFVAEFNKIFGWVHISIVEPLESNSFGELRGIVVNKDYRGKGIGTKLIKSAENWVKSMGCNRIRIRTNVKRIETREYYSKLGFTSKKMQEVFEKAI